jgi:CHAD domain-containing protein
VARQTNGTPPSGAQGRLHLPAGLPLRQGVVRAMREVTAHAEQMARLARRRPSFAVHEWRKSMRRARALLRLFRHLLDHGDRERITAALRTAQRAASDLRDADVLLPVVEELVAEKHTGAKQRVALVRIKRQLRSERRRRRDPGNAARAALSRQLPAVRAAVSLFERRLPPEVGVDDLEVGLGKSYRRAVAAFHRTCKDTADDVAFHDLRKATKVLHYQAEFLSQAGDARGERVRKQLSQLAEAQGRVTDLLVLRADVAAPGHRSLGSLEDLLENGIARRRRPAQRAARKLLSKLPGRFARRLVSSARKALRAAGR